MLDFDSFKIALKKATKESFLKLKDVPDLYAFALFSDEYCQTILAVANTASHLKKMREDYEDLESLNCKFSPEEWDFTLLNSESKFEQLTSLLAKKDEYEKNEKEFTSFQNQFYSICFDTLFELKEEGFFKENYSKDIFLIFEASEYELESLKQKQIIKSLNDNEYAKEYLNWMNTWEE